MATQTFFDPHSRQAVLAIRWNDDYSVIDVLAREQVVAALGQYDLRERAMLVELPNGTVAAIRLMATQDGEQWDIRRTGNVLVGGRIDLPNDEPPRPARPTRPSPRGHGADAAAPRASVATASAATASVPTASVRPAMSTESALPGYKAAPITAAVVERRPDAAVAVRRISPRAVLPSPRTIGAGAGTPIPAGSWALPAPRSLIDVGPAVDLATVATLTSVARVIRPEDFAVPALDAAVSPEDSDATPRRFSLPSLSTGVLGVMALICNLVGALTWGHDVLLALDLLVALAAGGALAALGRAFAAEKLDPTGPEPLVAICAASLSLMWAAFHLSDHPATAFAVFVVNGAAAMHFARVSLAAHAAEIAARSRATSAAGAFLAA